MSISSVQPNSTTIGKVSRYEYNHGPTTVVIEQEASADKVANTVATILENRKVSDGHLPKAEHLNGSRLPVGNMTAIIKANSIDSEHRTLWARESEYGCVASNQDRSTPHVQMLRVWQSQSSDQTFETTNYLGRADTKERLQEQVKFIIENNPEKLAPVEDENHTHTHTFTYFVNSLTKNGKIRDLSPLDERESLKQEKKLLAEENIVKVTIDGRDRNVLLKPIHIHQNISDAGQLSSCLLNDNLNGKKLEQDINKEGYNKLFDLINDMTDGPNKTLATQLKDRLENRAGLSQREQFIFTDILQRLVGLIAVYHCKSSVDRGGTAAAIGATNAHFLKKEGFSTVDEIEKKIKSDEYKEMFFAQFSRAHQETLPARFGMDEDGELTGKQRLGIKMYGEVLTDSLPSGMVKETLWEKSSGVRKFTAAIATIAYVLLFPIIIAVMFAIGHLFLGIGQLITWAKKGKSIAGRMGDGHALLYSLTPWNMHKAVHKHIDYSNETMQNYRLLGKAKAKK